MPAVLTAVRVPKYRHNKATDRAVVTLNGRDHWLGKFGTPESRAAYDRLIAEWMSNGRQAPVSPDDLTVTELIARFWTHAEQHYRDATGAPTSELGIFKLPLRPLKALYGPTLAKEFGPKALKAVRQKMIDSGWCRSSINRHVGRIRSVFRWAVENELIPATVHHSLTAVKCLQRGRCEAPESEPVKPVPDADIEAVRPFVSRQVEGLIDLQLLTGARPGELVAIRGRDIDTAGRLWQYVPPRHKTQHHGHARTIYFGPRAQALIARFLKPDLSAPLFSPAEAESERLRELHEKRKTPLSCGNRPGTNRRKKPERQPGEHYTVATYRRAIERACDQAFPLPPELARAGRLLAKWKARRAGRPRPAALAKWKPLVDQWRADHRWHPHQLRHNAATRLRKEYGLEAAQVILGHQTLTVTQVYAEKNISAAMRIMGEVG